MINERMQQLAGILTETETDRHVFSRSYMDIEKRIRNKADKLGCHKEVYKTLDKIAQQVERDPKGESDYKSEWLEPLEKAIDNLIQALKI